METLTKTHGRKPAQIDTNKHRNATRLQEYRLLRGYTQQQLADAVGVTLSAISNAERRRGSLNLYRWSQLADLLEVDFRLLLGFPVKPQKNLSK